MKVAINKETLEIVDLLPNTANENTKFIVNNNYALLDIPDPVLSSETLEDMVTVLFRDLTHDEKLLVTNKDFKINRQLSVDNIEVNYKGSVFQGDETSQNRLNRALVGLPDNGTITWKTKDNQAVVLNREDLREILHMAGQKQTRLWFG